MNYTPKTKHATTTPTRLKYTRKGGKQTITRVK